MTVECVVNVSEGRDMAVVAAIVAAGGQAVMDVHSDAHHHRSVVTIGGPEALVEAATRAVVAQAIATIDLAGHAGVHPRLGAADVVPFVPLPVLGGDADGSPAEAVARVVSLRDRFARWAGTELALPCFRYGYGTGRTLPEVRRQAFTTLSPDAGPSIPHPTAGATAAGARGVLIAYNLWLAPVGGVPAIALARDIARQLRSPEVRSLALDVGGVAQVSCNLVAPDRVGVADVYDRVAGWAELAGSGVDRAELVGLATVATVKAVPIHRWIELDVSPDRTIEARLESAGTGTGA